MFVAALAAAGCGPLEADLCDYKCECEGCSDPQYDDCLHKYDNDLYAAEREGCEAEYDELLACEDDTGECHGDHWDTRCGGEKDAFKQCVDHKGK
jgi:hypothetical protein